MGSRTFRIAIILVVAIISTTWTAISIKSGTFADIPAWISTSSIGFAVLKYVEGLFFKLRNNVVDTQSLSLKIIVLLLIGNTAVTWSVLSFNAGTFLDLPLWLSGSNTFAFLAKYADGFFGKLRIEQDQLNS